MMLSCKKIMKCKKLCGCDDDDDDLHVDLLTFVLGIKTLRIQMLRNTDI